MHWLEAVQAIFLGIVEGLTEFLPISSTGHLIVAGAVVRFNGEGADTFFVAIQAGAILAVCWYYRDRIISILKNLFHLGKDQRLAVNTVVAFIPAALIGLMLAKAIKMYLFNPVTVAVTLIVGGIVILLVENINIRKAWTPRVETMDDMTVKDAFGVGCMQCLALIPGMSRSGATIIGGMVLGLSRRAATEFSFFLSIPTIFGATVYDLFKNYESLSVEMGPAILLGGVVSFISAIVVVKWLLAFVSHNDFRGFGWYRIVFGLVVLFLAAESFI